MCEPTETTYSDGEIVWVKLGSCWWPGEVIASEKLPPDVLPSFRKPPIAIVKFFQEDTYEYVKNINSIYKYNCSRKKEFINKGLYLYRTKHGHMEKFPEDVIRAETAVGGDSEILTREEYQEQKKESYAGLFGDPRKTPSNKKGRGGRVKSTESPQISTPIRKTKDKAGYQVHILLQGSKTPSEALQSPGPAAESSSRRTSVSAISDTNDTVRPQENENENENIQEDKKATTNSCPPLTSTSGIYACHACPFTTSRLNVLILHNKTHSVTFIPYTPSPVRIKPLVSPKLVKVKVKPQKPKQKKEKTERIPKKGTLAKKRNAESSIKTEIKKPKTDTEIKSKLLADWDDVDEESNDESSTMAMTASPEAAVAAEAAESTVPIPADLPSAQVPIESSLSDKKYMSNDIKPESSSDSKYEFCEDEDWPLEADAGRKIPRVKNSRRKEDTKSLSLDEEDMANKVDELLNSTTVPELPSVPEPLKIEENFPEPSIVKSPDKEIEPLAEKPPEKPIIDTPPTKAIFKTKTFFRSRHSRSQDAIGKYVAEQLNAVERMDDNEINGSDAVSSPEARESPPIEQVKVARLAPKIQLKKMKAEAAQLREREKLNMNAFEDTYYHNSILHIPFNPSESKPELSKTLVVTHETQQPNASLDVLYPTPEIKPINIERDRINTLSFDFTETFYKDKQKKPCDDSHKMVDIVEDNSKNLKTNSERDTENLPELKFPKTTVDNSYEPYMNESTASAVDALLSVSREADRVTRHISDDPPEDLFEDDTKESGCTNSVNDNISSSEDVNINKENENIAINNENEISTSNNKNELIDNIIGEPITQEQQEKSKDPVADEDTSTNYVVETELQSETYEQKPTEAITETICMEHISENVPVESHVKEIVTESIVEEILTKPDSDELCEAASKMDSEPITEITPTDSKPDVVPESYSENLPSESDLQIAETLINFPSAALQNPSLTGHHENVPLQTSQEHDTSENIVQTTETISFDDMLHESKQEVKPISPNFAGESLLISNKNVRFETEQEKSENLNAAQSLVQMSESIDRKINIIDSKNDKTEFTVNNDDIRGVLGATQKNGIDNANTVEQKLALLSNENNSESQMCKSSKFETTSTKLLKILEEPCAPMSPIKNSKHVIVSNKEKILNFDVAKASEFKNKVQSPKQKIIIRRTAAHTKNLINNIGEITTPDKIVLSRCNNTVQEGSSLQTYTIKSAPENKSDTNTIAIQQKIKKIPKPAPKLQKIKPNNSLVAPQKDIKIVKETSNSDESMFDINSMPIVLSEDLLTAENIDKMPIVMSDGNLITHPSPNPPKLVKSKPVISENEKLTKAIIHKQEPKTLLLNPPNDGTKVVTTPNIISKSSKLRTNVSRGKPMLVINKTTGKQKIIINNPESAVKEVQQPTLIQPAPQSAKAEKIILLPAQNLPRPQTTRTQKIVIDPQTGKAHVLIAKGQEAPLNTNDGKPMAAKLVSTATNPNISGGNTVMIITNAQGAQSRILLAPEHEKMLFPNKQQNVTQIKSITQRITSAPTLAHKTILSTNAPLKNQTATLAKAPTQTRIVSKQKSAIITSKGQLIVGGRVATTAQNIAPLPEIRPAQKRIVASEPKKIVPAVQKASEPLIFLQQKSGAVMQLTAAQFEHLQKTGQIVQKSPSLTQENKIQKTVSKETTPMIIQKQRARKAAAESPAPMKRLKHEIPIAPVPTPSAPLPALAPFSNNVPLNIPPASNTVSVTTSTPYSELENFEELLPSTAIERPIETPVVPQTEQPVPQPVPQPAPLSDGQLLAIAGEHFGGPPGSFYLCVEDNGTLTPIDNRPLVLENNQLVPMMVEPVPVLASQPERRDILEAALANSDVFHADTTRDDAPDFRDLNANVSVHCRVSETSTTLNQPIMTPVEMPTKADAEPTVPSNLEDGLAVIGVTPHTVPTSLELPITVTDPRIAPKTTDPLSANNYGTTLLPSPNTELTFMSTEEADVPMVGPISMPLLTEEEPVGKSMPILTDEVTERAVSSVESGSLSSEEAREDGEESRWSRRLLTPASDTSEASSEIPLQPHIQFSVGDISRHS